MVSVFLTGSWLLHIRIILFFSPLNISGNFCTRIFPMSMKNSLKPHSISHFLQYRRMNIPLAVFCQGLFAKYEYDSDSLPKSPPVTVDTVKSHLQRSFLLYVLSATIRRKTNRKWILREKVIKWITMLKKNVSENSETVKTAPEFLSHWINFSWN